MQNQLFLVRSLTFQTLNPCFPYKWVIPGNSCVNGKPYITLSIMSYLVYTQIISKQRVTTKRQQCSCYATLRKLRSDLIESSDSLLYSTLILDIRFVDQEKI